MARKTRLDTLVVERGLAATRARARALVIAGHVSVDGVVVEKAGAPVRIDAEVTLATPDHPWVGRGGVKLADALDVFGLSVLGRTALDIGASTGGFTDVLLDRGATRVGAIDVGHGQLAWKLRQDARVVVLEGVNARYLDPTTLPQELRQVDLITVDVAFISLTLILPQLPPLLRDGGVVVALVKPQFEAGRDEVGPGGVVVDPSVRARVVDTVSAAADRVGLERVAVAPASITGAEGNQEFFLHLRRARVLPGTVSEP